MIVKRRTLIQRALAGLAAASGLALAAPLRKDMSATATTILLLHIFVGAAVSVWGFRAFRRLWFSTDRGKRMTIALLALSAGTGFLEVLQALSGRSVTDGKPLWGSHLAFGLLAGLAGLLFVVKQWRGVRRLKLHGATALMGLLPIGGCGMATLVGGYQPEHHELSLTATTAEQAKNPLFPAQVRDENGNAAHLWGSQTSERCGQSSCHANVHSEWSLSAHRSAGENPLYIKALTDFRSSRGPKAGLWCAGCHDPQRAVRNDLSISISKETASGVDCLSCHAMESGERYGNGAYALNVQEPYPFAEAESGWRKRLHQFFVNVRPAPHRFALKKPILSTSANCIPCHQQSYEAAQNGYRHIRTMETASHWREGAASGRSVMNAFPEISRKVQRSECQSCHFENQANGKLSHSSAATIKKAEASLDLFALRVRERPGREGERWLAPLEEAPFEAGFGGKEATLDILVINLSGAHSIPDGYEDLKDVWLEIDVAADGVSIYRSGQATADGSLPKGTSRFGSNPLDRDGNRIWDRSLQRQVASLPSTSIKSGASALLRHTFKIPSSAKRLAFSARLLYRSLNKEASDWTYGKGKANSAVTEIANAKTELTIGKLGQAAKSEFPEWQRWTRYGLAALDLQTPEPDRALRALQRAQAIAPMQPEVALAMGRCYLREPALLAARSQFERARQLAPNSDEAAFGLGCVLRQQGQYDAALGLLVPLCERPEYKEDAILLRETAKAYYYSGRYSEAAARLEQALVANPDDERAHFELQQCYRRLQRIPEARREETILRYLSVTPWSEAIQRKAARSARP